MLALDLGQKQQITLRDYQQTAVDAVKNAYSKGKQGVFLVAPTGAGKTQMFTSLTEEWVSQGSVVAIAAHRTELIKQASKTVLSRGLLHGIVKAGPSTCPQAPIQIVSIDSMRSRGLPQDPDYIILDEAHLAKAKRYLTFLNIYRNAKLLLVSATPLRTDGSGFDDLAEELIVSATVNDLVGHPEGPYLVPPRLYTGSDIGDIDVSVKTTAGDYNQGELEEYMCRVELVGDVLKEYQRLASGRKGVIFCVGIKHSQTICEEFNAAGIRTEHIDGTMSEFDRAGILHRLHTGETQIVTNCGILCEGWDEPSISYVGLARPTKSTALYIQQAGRGLRIHPQSGKSDCVIIDHGQNVDLHGHILDDREWSLYGKGKVKVKKKKPRQCPKCENLIPQKINKCWACGWEKVTVLEVVTTEKVFEEKKVEHPLIKEYRKRLRYAKSKGLKPGWAYFKLIEIHGKATVDSLVTYRLSMQIQKEEGLR